MAVFISFGIAFILSLSFLGLLIRFLQRYNIIDHPRADRWHRSPTPKFGGIGIFAAFAIAFIIAYYHYTGRHEPFPLTLSLSMVLMFLFGLIDDIKSLTPVGKFVTQIVAASVAVFFGYTTNFFTPRLGDTILAQILNDGLSLFWLVAITNAMNLLDNMDGLAGGISFIVCLVMGYFFWDSDELLMVIFCSALAGAILGFLFLNFPPAKIFMGDSGSQFLGFTLALLAIARQPQASNVFAILGVPTLLFTLPLADTIFVTVTRLLRGQSPFKGGRDHTSHRLIAFGLSERQALWVLYTIALVGGITAMVVESLNYTLSLFLLPLMIVFLLIFTTYLAGVKITDRDNGQKQGITQRVIVQFVLGRSLLEVILDSLLISFSFYVAVFFGMPLSAESQIEVFTQNLPLALISGYVAFFFTRIYRDIWRHLRVETIYRYVQASVLAVFILAIFRLIFSTSRTLNSSTLLIFGAMLIVGLMVTRFSFQALDSVSTRSRKGADRILLYAPQEKLEYLIPYFMSRSNENFRLAGLIIDNDYQVGKRIFDVRVVGKLEDISVVITQIRAKGIFVEESIANEPSVKEKLFALCREGRCWVKVLAIRVEELEKHVGVESWRRDDAAYRKEID